METARRTNAGDLNVGGASFSDTERIGPQNDSIASLLHGEMTEVARTKRMFHAASQAATTTTIALATTYTGLCLSNPASNTKDLIPRILSVALSVAPAGIAPMALGGGMTVAGVVTHTTPLSTFNNVLGDGGAATGLADGAATLPAAPRVIMPILGGFTAGALFGTSPAIVNIGGGIIIPPGGYVFVYTLTVAVGLFGIWWEEVDR